MLKFDQTEPFSKWLNALKDPMGRAKVLTRLRRAVLGHFGDVKAVGDGICESRIDYGPGYRVYFAQSGEVTYLLLGGGCKSGQCRDITQAKRLWDSIRKG